MIILFEWKLWKTRKQILAYKPHLIELWYETIRLKNDICLLYQVGSKSLQIATSLIMYTGEPMFREADVHSAVRKQKENSTSSNVLNIKQYISLSRLSKH